MKLPLPNKEMTYLNYDCKKILESVDFYCLQIKVVTDRYEKMYPTHCTSRKIYKRMIEKSKMH